MSIHSCVVTSWPMRAIGKRGARSSGPMGCLVPGCSGGDGGAGIEGTTLNQAVGIWFSRSRNLVSSDGIGSSLRSRSEKLLPRPGRKASEEAIPAGSGAPDRGQPDNDAEVSVGLVMLVSMVAGCRGWVGFWSDAGQYLTHHAKDRRPVAPQQGLPP